MRAGRASWTAEMTAVFRATESIRPGAVRLFHDRYAAHFLRPIYRLILKSRPLALFMVWLMVDRRFPGASTTISSRVRFVDDCLRIGIDSGIGQLVLLGAGYDSRAYRFSALKDRRVFEVDHPRTQKSKKDKLLDLMGSLPAHVVYVPVDFEKDDLMAKLTGAGYRHDLKTLFIWEGVSKYLTASAVKDLLSAVSANSRKGSAIVFDYLFQSMVDGRSGGALVQKILSIQAEKGEPFIFGLPEESPERFVMASGFAFVKNFTAARIKQLVLDGMSRARDLHPFWGIIYATV